MNPAAVMASWLLTGMALGLLSTVYGAFRIQWHWWKIFGHIMDWLWFVLAAVIILAVYLWTDWGVFHVWSLLLIAIGYGLWAWLAAPWVLKIVSPVIFFQARVVFYLTAPVRFIGQRLTALGRHWRVRRSKKLPPANPPQM
ncbi:MAG: hypothetical protein OWR62_14085 [Sulfobacillus thermotolerans]|nr:hypothetical protein [Sulfobacillus thermotolerans]